MDPAYNCWDALCAAPERIWKCHIGSISPQWSTRTVANDIGMPQWRKFGTEITIAVVLNNYVRLILCQDFIWTNTDIICTLIIIKCNGGDACEVLSSTSTMYLTVYRHMYGIWLHKVQNKKGFWGGEVIEKARFSYLNINTHKKTDIYIYTYIFISWLIYFVHVPVMFLTHCFILRGSQTKWC